MADPTFEVGICHAFLMFSWKMSAVREILSIFMQDCNDMRRLLTIAAILLTASLSAQEAPAGKEKNHQHALEFTTGYPGIFMLFEYGLGIEGFEGQRANRHFQHGLNIGYTFLWGKRWELNTLLNLHLTRYELYQYPKLEGSNGYDWDAEPTMIQKDANIYGAICATVRYKWLVRDSFSMYSALGVGFSHDVWLNDFPFPLPYIAPVGIKFGKGRVYGIVEVNVSAANTFGMAGIGVKL